MVSGNPDGGAHPGSSVDVTVMCNTDGATIRYTSGSGTTPGSDPTTNSTVVPVNGIVNVPVSGWLKARAWKDGMTESMVKTAVYTSRPAPSHPVTVEGNSMWNRYAYFSWRNITTVYQPDSNNAVIDTWKLDDNGNGDPRDGENRILWNGQTDTPNGIKFSSGNGPNAAHSGWDVNAYVDSYGNGVVVFSWDDASGTATATYTLRPDSPDLHGTLTLQPAESGHLQWGIDMINSVLERHDPGDMLLYDQAYLSGSTINARPSPVNQEPVEGVDFLTLGNVRRGLACITSTSKDWRSVFDLKESCGDVELIAEVRMASTYSGWPFSRRALARRPIEAGEQVTLRAVFRSGNGSETPYGVPFEWLNTHGPPTDGSVDNQHLNDSPFSVREEWRADTDPNNPADTLRMENPTIGVLEDGIVVRWRSSANRTYRIERSSNLTGNPPFVTLATDVQGVDGVAEYVDPTVYGSGPHFYRVRVE